MKINPVYIVFCSLIICFVFPACAQEAGTLVHYAEPRTENMPEIQTLSAQEDDLYAGAEIVPYNKELSAAEKQQEENSDLEYISAEYQRPELSCAQIQPRVKEFILQNLQTDNTNSVIEKRRRILLVNNLGDFHDIAEEDIAKNNFETKAALMHLKINERRDIYRICVSNNNTDKQLKDVYAIIYPYINYYKVVVSNLIKIPENLEDATFIYDWQ